MIDEKIVQRCLRSNPARQIISEFDGGRSVIEISETAIVKCGIGITHLETQNQHLAHDMIDQSIKRVPRVHRFFNHEIVRYIIMEYIEGQSLACVENSASYLQ